MNVPEEKGEHIENMSNKIIAKLFQIFGKI
jgi:hypothetical protein